MRSLITALPQLFLSLLIGFQLVSSGLQAASKPVDMRLLLLATNGTEPSLAALRYFLDRLGTPYSVALLASQPLPALDNGIKGYYQGVILTTGNLGICDPGCRSALSAADWTRLDNYTRDYSVRTVSYYTFPEPRYGLTYTGAVSPTDSSPAQVAFTSASSTIFPYLRRSSPIKVANAYTYLASPVAASGEKTTPILTLGNAVVGATHVKPDGREYLAFTMDNNPYLFHSQVFNYGAIRWVTKGVFVGARKAYLTPQSDDMFLPNDLFDPTLAACIPVGFTNDPTFDPAGQCPTLRITGADLDQLYNWQKDKRSKSQFANFRVSIAFNGYGATAEGGAPTTDDLQRAAKQYGSNFWWINHTFDHENLDCYDPVPNSGICRSATFAESVLEITENVRIGEALGLSLDYQSMVTPGISGLRNQAFLNAAASEGVRYLIADLSRPEGTPAMPNTGIVNPLKPVILMIPRRATSIFYNVVSGLPGAKGSEPDEYNHFYGPNGIFRIGGPGGPPFFTTNQTYAQIVDRESNTLLGYMLNYEVYPSMFHQSNNSRYSGKATLFTDVLDATMNKFATLSNLPVISVRQTALGKLMQDRMAFNASNAVATLTPGVSIQIAAQGAALVPITGICKENCQNYGSENQSSIATVAGSTKTITLP